MVQLLSMPAMRCEAIAPELRRTLRAGVDAGGFAAAIGYHLSQAHVAAWATFIGLFCGAAAGFTISRGWGSKVTSTLRSPLSAAAQVRERVSRPYRARDRCGEDVDPEMLHVRPCRRGRVAAPCPCRRSCSESRSRSRFAASR